MSDTSRPDGETARRVLPGTRARQGWPTRGMMGVLLGGLFLVIAAFAALYAYRAGEFNNANSNNVPASVHAADRSIPKQEAEAFHAPEPAAIVPQPGTDHPAPGPNSRRP
jgi:hypothetical protein